VILVSIAVAQSVASGLVVGRVTAGKGTVKTIAVSITAVIVMGLVAHAALRVLGFGYSFEGP
jgi:hypothetical protein